LLSKNGDDEGNQPHLIAIARAIERGRLLEAQETKSASLNREARRFHSSSVKILCYIKLDDTYLFDESRRRILAGVRDLKYDDSLVIICLLPV
jgi:hypothetical protein